MSNQESKILIISQELKDEIISSQKKVADGIFTDNDIFEKEFDEWLRNEK